MRVVLVLGLEPEHVERHHVSIRVPPHPREVGEQRLSRARRYLGGVDLVYLREAVQRVGVVGNGEVEVAHQVEEVDIHGRDKEASDLLVVADIDVGE